MVMLSHMPDRLEGLFEWGRTVRYAEVGYFDLFSPMAQLTALLRSHTQIHRTASFLPSPKLR